MFDAMKDLTDTKRKVQLQSPLTLDQLYSLIDSGVDHETLGDPSLKKSLFGKAIVFPKRDRVTPRITV